MLSGKEIQQQGYLEQPEFLEKVGMQLNKDFSLQEYFAEPALENLADLESRLFRLVTDMLESDNEKLFSILYRIDLKESTVRETFTEGKMDTVKLCEQILYRECLKVYFRLQYST